MGAVKAIKAIEPYQLGVAASTVYTAPDNTHGQILALSVSNNTATARTVTIAIQSAAALADVNTIWKTITIPPNTPRAVHEAIGHVLNPGDKIQALASAASAITIFGSILELVQ